MKNKTIKDKVLRALVLGISAQMMLQPTVGALATVNAFASDGDDSSDDKKEDKKEDKDEKKEESKSEEKTESKAEETKSEEKSESKAEESPADVYVVAKEAVPVDEVSSEAEKEVEADGAKKIVTKDIDIDELGVDPADLDYDENNKSSWTDKKTGDKYEVTKAETIKKDTTEVSDADLLAQIAAAAAQTGSNTVTINGVIYYYTPGTPSITTEVASNTEETAEVIGVDPTGLDFGDSDTLEYNGYTVKKENLGTTTVTWNDVADSDTISAIASQAIAAEAAGTANKLTVDGVEYTAVVIGADTYLYVPGATAEDAVSAKILTNEQAAGLAYDEITKTAVWTAEDGTVYSIKKNSEPVVEKVEESKQETLDATEDADLIQQIKDKAAADNNIEKDSDGNYQFVSGTTYKVKIDGLEYTYKYTASSETFVKNLTTEADLAEIETNTGTSYKDLPFTEVDKDDTDSENTKKYEATILSSDGTLKYVVTKKVTTTEYPSEKITITKDNDEDGILSLLLAQRRTDLGLAADAEVPSCTDAEVTITVDGEEITFKFSYTQGVAQGTTAIPVSTTATEDDADIEISSDVLDKLAWTKVAGTENKWTAEYDGYILTKEVTSEEVASASSSTATESILAELRKTWLGMSDTDKSKALQDNGTYKITYNDVTYNYKPADGTTNAIAQVIDTTKVNVKTPEVNASNYQGYTLIASGNITSNTHDNGNLFAGGNVKAAIVTDDSKTSTGLTIYGGSDANINAGTGETPVDVKRTALSSEEIEAYWTKVAEDVKKAANTNDNVYDFDAWYESVKDKAEYSWQSVDQKFSTFIQSLIKSNTIQHAGGGNIDGKDLSADASKEWQSGTNGGWYGISNLIITTTKEIKINISNWYGGLNIGAILAPKADVTVDYNENAMTIIARNITSNAQSHIVKSGDSATTGTTETKEKTIYSAVTKAIEAVSSASYEKEFDPKVEEVYSSVKSSIEKVSEVAKVAEKWTEKVTYAATSLAAKIKSEMADVNYRATKTTDEILGTAAFNEKVVAYSAKKTTEVDVKGDIEKKKPSNDTPDMPKKTPKKPSTPSTPGNDNDNRTPSSGVLGEMDVNTQAEVSVLGEIAAPETAPVSGVLGEIAGPEVGVLGDVAAPNTGDDMDAGLLAVFAEAAAAVTLVGASLSLRKKRED